MTRRTAEEKRQALWDRVRAEPYEGELPGQSGEEFVRALSVVEDKNAFLMASFEHTDDVLPERTDVHGNPITKIFHRRGTVASVCWLPGPDAGHYTGFLRTGGVGLLRASLVSTRPDETFSPGIALKMFVDDDATTPRPSVNLVASYRLEGMALEDPDFFRFPFTTTIPTPKRPAGTPRFDRQLQFYQWRALVGIFESALAWTYRATTSARPESLPVDEAARTHGAGALADNEEVRAPPMLRFTAPRALRERLQAGWDFRERLAELEAGTYLLAVEAVEQEQTHDLGHIVLASPFVASAFGDEQLFFRHPAPRGMPLRPTPASGPQAEAPK